MSSTSTQQAFYKQHFPLYCALHHDSIGVGFVAIPKVGCTALKNWLIALVDPISAAQPSLDMHRYAIERLSLCRMPRADATRILCSIPFLAFVRDPAERLRSAYIDKLVRPVSDDLFPPSVELLTDWYAAHRASPPDFDRRISFREFIEHVASSPHDRLDEHWRPQISFLLAPSRKPDLLIPLGEMSHLLNQVATALGRPDCIVKQTNVTRKEPSTYRGTIPLADLPAGELHRLNLRPTLNDLADDRVLACIRAAMADDLCLHEEALHTFNHEAFAAVLARCKATPLPLSSPTI